ncbi:hypothetical protein BKA64DRAFT_171516 [Cadophora sp. MPI-SDFR-AT-0126]|nr:hypothetical protein BKA64DRAFT_171516 [Leotiomycetes sp. MPI-SDFR-AT-0126]
MRSEELRQQENKKQDDDERQQHSHPTSNKPDRPQRSAAYSRLLSRRCTRTSYPSLFSSSQLLSTAPPWPSSFSLLNQSLLNFPAPHSHLESQDSRSDRPRTHPIPTKNHGSTRTIHAPCVHVHVHVSRSITSHFLFFFVSVFHTPPEGLLAFSLDVAVPTSGCRQESACIKVMHWPDSAPFRTDFCCAGHCNSVDRVFVGWSSIVPSATVSIRFGSDISVDRSAGADCIFCAGWSSWSEMQFYFFR